MSGKLFVVAYCQQGDYERVLYHDGAPPSMDFDEPGFGADDEYWPLPSDPDAYPLLTFEGDWHTLAEEHAETCGCDEMNGPECEGGYNTEWSWLMGGKWRKATAADLIRASLVASTAETTGATE